MRLRRSARTWSLPVVWVATVMGGCGSEGPACDPTNPICATGGSNQIDAISITSPVDSVLAAGSTVRLQAVAADSRGVVVPAVVNWTSSDDAVAAVSSTGLVSALATGSATITASSGAASVTYPIRVVDARLAEIGPVLSDPLIVSGVSAMSGAAAAELEDALEKCDDALVASHVLAVDSCLAAAWGVSPENGTDRALMGVFSLFFAHARELLDLGG